MPEKNEQGYYGIAESARWQVSAKTLYNGESGNCKDMDLEGYGLGMKLIREMN